MNNYNDNEPVNAGSGEELSIKDLAELVADIVGYNGEIIWDTSKPNGTPRKLLDLSKISNMGWKPETYLKEGISKAYKDFKGDI